MKKGLRRVARARVYDSLALKPCPDEEGIKTHGDSLSSPDELERRFNAVLSDEKAMIYQTKSGRLLVYSPQENRLAVVSVDGQRISVHRPDPGFLTTLGNHQWQIKQMID